MPVALIHCCRRILAGQRKPGVAHVSRSRQSEALYRCGSSHLVWRGFGRSPRTRPPEAPRLPGSRRGGCRGFRRATALLSFRPDDPLRALAPVPALIPPAPFPAGLSILKSPGQSTASASMHCCFSRFLVPGGNQNATRRSQTGLRNGNSPRAAPFPPRSG